MAKKNKLFDIKSLPMDMARLVSIPIWLAFRLKKLTPDGKPYRGRLQGSALLAANHSSMADPLLVIGSFWYRRVHFLAAEAVMSNKVKSTLLKGAGAIRIDRNAADIEAVNRSVEVLQAGRLLAVFPQGSIQKAEGISTLKSGITLIALRAGVPIIPMMILPRKKWYSRTAVVIGQPLVPSEHVTGPFPTMTDIEKITGLLADRMKMLGEVAV